MVTVMLICLYARIDCAAGVTVITWVSANSSSSNGNGSGQRHSGQASIDCYLLASMTAWLEKSIKKLFSYLLAHHRHWNGLVRYSMTPECLVCNSA